MSTSNLIHSVEIPLFATPTTSRSESSVKSPPQQPTRETDEGPKKTTNNWDIAALFHAQGAAASGQQRFPHSSPFLGHLLSQPCFYYRHTHPSSSSSSSSTTDCSGTSDRHHDGGVPYRENITGVFERNALATRIPDIARRYIKDEGLLLRHGIAAKTPAAAAENTITNNNTAAFLFGSFNNNNSDHYNDDDSDEYGDNTSSSAGGRFCSFLTCCFKRQNHSSSNNNARRTRNAAAAARRRRQEAEWKRHCHNLLLRKLRQNQPKMAEDTTNAFLVHGLLSAEDCAAITAVAEPLLAPLDGQYAQKHRKASRAMLRCPALTRRLYERLLPHLCAETDYRGRIPLCFGQDGVWVPFGLNECLKVFAYEPGGQFVPHRDGPWVPREDQCSMYTVVVYLNEAMRGGETMLLGTAPTCAPQGVRTMTTVRSTGGCVQIPPSTGSALIFNHDCWHAGLPVLEGRKLILRTELIFQRVQSFYVNRHAFRSDAEYQRTRALYDASQQALKEGRREAFFEQYQEVVALQQVASQRSGTHRRRPGPRLLAAIGADAVASIVAFIGVCDRSLPHLLAANRSTFEMVTQCPVWERELRHRYGPGAALTLSDDATTSKGETIEEEIGTTREPVNMTAAAADLDEISLTRSVTGAICGITRALLSTSSDAPNVSNASSITTTAASMPPILQDHFARFKHFRGLRQAFSPACLVVRDASGALLISQPATVKEPNPLLHISSEHGDRPQLLERFRFSSANEDEKKEGVERMSGHRQATAGLFPFSSNEEETVALTTATREAAGMCDDFQSHVLPACFGDWAYAYPYHMNQPDGERFSLYANSTSAAHNIVRGTVRPITMATTATANTLTPAADIIKSTNTTAAVSTDWSILSVAMELTVEPIATPLLLCPSPHAWSSHKSIQTYAQEAQEGIFGLLRAPALAVLHPALCVMLGHAAVTAGGDGFLSPSNRGGDPRTYLYDIASNNGSEHSLPVSTNDFQMCSFSLLTPPAEVARALHLRDEVDGGGNIGWGVVFLSLPTLCGSSGSAVGSPAFPANPHRLLITAFGPQNNNTSSSSPTTRNGEGSFGVARFSAGVALNDQQAVRTAIFAACDAAARLDGVREEERAEADVVESTTQDTSTPIKAGTSPVGGLRPTIGPVCRGLLVLVDVEGSNNTNPASTDPDGHHREEDPLLLPLGRRQLYQILSSWRGHGTDCPDPLAVVVYTDQPQPPHGDENARFHNSSSSALPQPARQEDDMSAEAVAAGRGLPSPHPHQPQTDGGVRFGHCTAAALLARGAVMALQLCEYRSAATFRL